MKIYLDTGNLEEIQQGLDYGIVDGVTTNPTLIAREGVPFEKRVKEIVAAFKKAGVKDFTVSAEVTTLTAPEMIKQAARLAKIDSHVVIKIPLTPEGIKAVSTLSKKKIKTNVTLCFSANQALLAAKAGAYIISPFVGRLDDIDQDGMGLVEEIRIIYDNYDIKTQILTASVRHPQHVMQAAEIGSDIITVPFKVFEKLFIHPLTDKGLAKFMEDWKEYERKVRK